jgi:hypothetical protein
VTGSDRKALKTLQERLPGSGGSLPSIASIRRNIGQAVSVFNGGAVMMLVCCLTDRASAAATFAITDYLTFLRSEAPVSCMRLLGTWARAPRSSA